MSTKPKTLKALKPIAATDAAPVTLAIASAIKALHDGVATAHQQQIALQWIVRDASGKAQFPYHQTDRDTAFALGRYFVAEQIIGLFNADLSSLRRDAHVETTERTSQA